MHSFPPRHRWTVVVPLKASVRGKSRLGLPPELRRRVALAMAIDTVTAATASRAVSGVLAVVEDRADGEELRTVAGLRVLVSRPPGLNRAIGVGLRTLGPLSADPIAVLPADLPSLTADELTAALDAAQGHPLTVVADRQGTGTTMLTALSAGLLDPQYGTDSLRRHVVAGAFPIELPVESGLRRDVDQLEDLAGVTGPRTLAVLAESGWPTAPATARRRAGELCRARPAG